MISSNVINHVTGGVESIAGLHGEYWVQYNFNFKINFFFLDANDY